MRTCIERSWLAILMAAALAHGVAYALLVPLWQTPDEPMLFEYTALVEQLRRIPSTVDRSRSLETRIADSLARTDFWRYTTGATPRPAPRTMDDVNMHFWMPRQVGGDPPAYFVASALPLHLAADWSIERQALLLRLLNAALLPLVLLCAYGAARELSTALADQEARALALAVSSLVAFQPMATAIGASLGNDGPANLLGAALCWIWLRIVGRGATPRRVGTLVALLALGLLTKRTILPYVVLTALAGGAWLALRMRVLLPWRKGRADGVNGILHRAALVWSSVGVGAAALVLGLWLAGQFDWGTAWGWYPYGSHQPATRVWVADQHRNALRLVSGELVVQPLASATIDDVRRRRLHFGARVWSDGDATGRLVILNGTYRDTIPFRVRRDTVSIEITAPLRDQKHLVVVGIAADTGTLYAATPRAKVDGLSLTVNESLSLPGIHPGSPLLIALGYLRLPDMLWALQRLGHRGGLPHGWIPLLFASFWGHFGWMNVPFVLDTPWLWLLLAFCAYGVVGLPLALRRVAGRGSHMLWLLVTLCVIALLLPLLNALTMPEYQKLQQGRYLFPVLVPLALLIALGQSALTPPRWRRGRLGVWVAFWAIFAASALAHVAGHYVRL